MAGISYSEVAHAVYRRATAGTQHKLQLPDWTPWVVLVNLVLFIPIVIVVKYTFGHVYPVLAMVEDSSPPAYNALSLDSQETETGKADSECERRFTTTDNKTPRAITSSIREIHRTLVNISGWRSYFRGLGCLILGSFGTFFALHIISGLPFFRFVPITVLAPVVALFAVQISAAWTHIVITQPSSKSLLQRLPPFKTASRATALPTMLYYLSFLAQFTLPKVFAKLLQITEPKVGKPFAMQSSDAWKGLLVVALALFIAIFCVIPAGVVLIRTQASILPEDDETIVHFDRSFQGLLEPAIIGGRGYATVRDAWKTFSTAAWIRLVKLYVKLAAVSLAMYAAFAVILVPQIWFVISMSVLEVKETQGH